MHIYSDRKILGRKRVAMNISQELAEPIITRLRSTLDYPVSITDMQGVIIASTYRDRIGKSHGAAVEAIASKTECLVSEERALRYSNTFSGITIPLMLYDECVGAVCLRGNPEELKQHASIISIAVISLLETAELSYQANARQRLADTWVSHLTSDSVKDYEHCESQAHILGIDCTKLSSVLVIQFHPVTYSELPMLEKTIIEVADVGQGLQFISYVGQGQFVCGIPVAELEGLTELHQTCEALSKRLSNLNLQVHIGVGRPNRSIQGYRQSYQDAFHSARVAERLGSAKRILYYNEQHLFRLLEGVPDYIRTIFITNQTEGRTWDPVLLETLQTYFAMDCHVNETARALYIHRNTLLFRLNKIADIYGLDPRKFNDALVLNVLLYLLELSKSEKPEVF